MAAGKEPLRGIVPSVNTPFSDAGEVDLASVRRVVDHIIGAGCSGMLVLAVAGEGETLTTPEVAKILETIVDQTDGRLPVIASVTAATQDERLRRARAARSIGADWILCQAPRGHDGERLLAAIGEIADAGPDFFMLQDLDWSGAGLPLEVIRNLFDRVPQFQSLKIEVVPAGPKYTRVLEATDGGLHVSGGWAVSQMLDALDRGVQAFMPTELESLYVTIHRLHVAGRMAEARALFEAILPAIAFSNQHIDISIRFFKALRKARGAFTSERCRLEIAPFDSFQSAEAARLVDRVLALEEQAFRDYPELHGARP